MVNKFKPHVLVLPEDRANNDIAVGFQLEVKFYWNISIERPAGGWGLVCEKFRDDYVSSMINLPLRHMILLVDFDNTASRLQTVKAHIPSNLTNRVFVLGTLSEPEDLKRQGLGSYEDIGRKLADDCRSGNQRIWAHQLLSHNQSELNRLCGIVGPILF